MWKKPAAASNSRAVHHGTQRPVVEGGQPQLLLSPSRGRAGLGARAAHLPPPPLPGGAAGPGSAHPCGPGLPRTGHQCPGPGGTERVGSMLPRGDGCQLPSGLALGHSTQHLVLSSSPITEQAAPAELWPVVALGGQFWNVPSQPAQPPDPCVLLGDSSGLYSNSRAVTVLPPRCPGWGAARGRWGPPLSGGQRGSPCHMLAAADCHGALAEASATGPPQWGQWFSLSSAGQVGSLGTKGGTRAEGTLPRQQRAGSV